MIDIGDVEPIRFRTEGDGDQRRIFLAADRWPARARATLFAIDHLRHGEHIRFDVANGKAIYRIGAYDARFDEVGLELISGVVNTPG